MKKCPECLRTYDDNLSYCLQDGKALMTVVGDEFAAEAETQIKAKPFPAATQPSINPNPADDLTILSPPPPTYETPKPRKSKINFFLLAALFIALGVIVGGGLVLLLGGFSRDQVAVSNKSLNNKTNLETPEPRVAEEKTPEDEDNSEDDVSDNFEEDTDELTATPTPEPKVCFLSDGGNGGGEVNVRRDCDTLDCTLNPATIARTYSNKTSITKLGKSVRSGDYNWEKVNINGGTFWVADSKIRCE